MDLEPEDVLVSAKLAHETDHVILVTSDGQSVRFPVAELRSASRASGGVRGLRLAKDARLVSMEVVSAGDQLFTLTRNGFGKRTPHEEYPIHHRGGAGVITFKVLDKTGPVATARMVKDSQELIVISQDGIVLRTRMDGISIQGRSTQGVAVIGLSPGDAVASVAVIEMAQEQGEASADGPEPAESPGEQQRLAEANEPAPEAQAPKKTSGKATDTPKQPKAGSSARADAALGKADTAMKKAKAAETKAKAGANKQDARTQRNGSSGRQKRTRGR